LRSRERLRNQNFRLALVGLVLIFAGLGAILLWTRYRSPIALVLAILCIFIGLVLVTGLGWFPMMGVEKWRL
jgi:NhaP-type Na+/H+ or K+/H+ antiporter